MAEQNEEAAGPRVGADLPTVADRLLASWRLVEQLVGRMNCTPESTIDRIRYLVEREAAAEAKAGVPHVDRVEAAAQVLHSRRHRLGWSSVCGRCRDDAAAVLAVLS